jgi:NAD(P)-dependent dehydrogenase (short-subunit alcohol dehydrogenase family)
MDLEHELAELRCSANQETVGDPYTFTKEAIIVYTMQKAFTSAASGIRVNCISPGPTATPMMPEFEKAAGADMIRAFEGPFYRKAQPEEQAWPLAFLVTDVASYITGVNLIVDGGFLAGAMTGAIDVAALMAQGEARLAAGGATTPS